MEVDMPEGANAEPLASRDGPWTALTVTLLLLVSVITWAAMLLGTFGSYGSLWGTAPAGPSDADIHRYELTAVVGIGAAVGALVVGIVGRSFTASIVSAAVLALTVLAAWTFALPADRSDAPAERDQHVEHYIPCYGEGAGCEGG